MHNVLIAGNLAGGSVVFAALFCGDIKYSVCWYLRPATIITAQMKKKLINLEEYNADLLGIIIIYNTYIRSNISIIP